VRPQRAPYDGHDCGRGGQREGVGGGAGAKPPSGLGRPRPPPPPGAGEELGPGGATAWRVRARVLADRGGLKRGSIGRFGPFQRIMQGMLKGVLTWYFGLLGTLLVALLVGLIQTGRIWSPWGLLIVVPAVLIPVAGVVGHRRATAPRLDEKRLLKWASQNQEVFTFTNELGVPDAVVVGGRTLFGWHARHGDEPADNARQRAHWLDVGQRVQARWGKDPSNPYVQLQGSALKYAHRLPEMGEIPNCKYEQLEKDAKQRQDEDRRAAEAGKLEEDLALGAGLSDEARAMLKAIAARRGKVGPASTFHEGEARRPLLHELREAGMLGKTPIFADPLPHRPVSDSELVIREKGKKYLAALNQSALSAGKT